MKPSLNSVSTLAIAFAVSALFVLLSVPLGEMFGSIIAIILLSKWGIKPRFLLIR
ncbi:hypothetical protein JCM19236_5870 [Vibrio sp. JCM 19236]|nr:hypothetical protein JCM19236_5870 [Vibrio sp. JCM 19236]